MEPLALHFDIACVTLQLILRIPRRYMSAMVYINLQATLTPRLEGGPQLHDVVIDSRTISTTSGEHTKILHPSSIRVVASCD